MSEDAIPLLKVGAAPLGRRAFIGGSDARVIMGADEAALLRLWREKRGEVEPEDLSDNLIVQIGLVTEPLNRHWFQRNTGHVITQVQQRVQHSVIRWMVATLDGMVEQTGAVFDPQLQHNMWVMNAKASVLSVITGGGKWVEIAIPADPLYQHLLLTAEKKFWRCVENGEPPRLFGIEPPRLRIEAVRIVDMSASNAWAEFSSVFRRTREAYLEHENAKTELKALMPEDAKEAIGHGIRAKRSKSGAVSFDVLREPPRSDHRSQSTGDAAVAARARDGIKLSVRSGGPVLTSEQSAILRERVLGQLVAINSTDEGAIWVRLTLSAKNTLTAGDARIVLEEFQTRLSTIGDGEGASEASNPVSVQNVMPVGRIDASAGRKISTGSGNA